MKALLMIILFLGFLIQSQAQYRMQSLVASSGDYFKLNSYQISWSLGEIAIETYTSDNLIVTQGFHQPEGKIVGIQENKTGGPAILIYPNPARDAVNIIIQATTVPDEYPDRYELYDVSGRLLDVNKITEKQFNLHIGKYSGALYFLRLLNSASGFSSTTIVQKLN